MGSVIRIKRFSNHVLYDLDDGTAVIQCIRWTADEVVLPSQDLRVFQEVKITGLLQDYKGSRQVKFVLRDTLICDDPNDLSLFRLRVVMLERFVYSKPVVLPASIVQEEQKRKEKEKKEKEKEKEKEREKEKEKERERKREKEEKRKKSQPPVSEDTLLSRIRTWISTRDEFAFIELFRDEETQRIACEIVRAKVCPMSLGVILG
ncbi:MAG: hypothetical protein J3Q66DRAFT_158842 [Benniella sp.]|nr:MAG: hypothetical protein J3Q66DRAFT_158842 [Benniella sp.]